MQTPEGLSKVRLSLLNLLKSREQAEVILFQLQALRAGYFCQAWTRAQECASLWKEYGDGCMSIRLEIDLEDVRKLNGVSTQDVQYVEEITLDEEVRKLIPHIGGDLHVGGILATKRAEFAHEKEIRLTSFDMRNANRATRTASSQKGMGIALALLHEKGEISQQAFETEKGYCEEPIGLLEPVLRVSFKDIPGFIKSVMLNPAAPNWFDETLKQYCEANELRYIGKSTLYKLAIQ